MQVSLKALRVNANLSQKSAADAIGVNAATIVSWEANRTFPNVRQLNALCSLYHCSKDDVFVPETLSIN